MGSLRVEGDGNRGAIAASLVAPCQRASIGRALFRACDSLVVLLCLGLGKRQSQMRSINCLLMEKIGLDRIQAASPDTAWKSHLL